MSDTNLLIGAITDVGTTQTQPLGAIYVEPPNSGGATDNTGERSWIYVYNDSGSNILASIACQRKAATSTYNVRASVAGAPSAGIAGVTSHAIPNLNYGWIIRKGVCVGTADATVNAELPLIPDGSTVGNVTHGAATDDSMGHTLQGRTGSGVLAILVNCRG